VRPQRDRGLRRAAPGVGGDLLAEPCQFGAEPLVHLDQLPAQGPCPVRGDRALLMAGHRVNSATIGWLIGVHEGRPDSAGEAGMNQLSIKENRRYRPEQPGERR
jgi:hypothetical protein